MLERTRRELSQAELGSPNGPRTLFHCDKEVMMGCILLPAFQITLIDTFPLAQ